MDSSSTNGTPCVCLEYLAINQKGMNPVALVNMERKRRDCVSDATRKQGGGERQSRTECKGGAFPYAIGEVYLAALPELREVEIEDIAPAASAVKIKREGWMDLAALRDVVKAKLGRAEYSGGLLGNQRKVVREI